jgi:CelD/BcsL family acetyltransferase involved in cellulose biosynthesis
MDQAEQARVLTRHLWEESSASWEALAAALRARGTHPKDVAVGDRFSDDGDKDFGVLVTKKGEKCSFVIQFLAKGRVAVDVQQFTGSQSSPYSDALAAARSVLDPLED